MKSPTCPPGNNHTDMNTIIDKFSRAISETLRINNSLGYITGRAYPPRSTSDFTRRSFEIGITPSLDIPDARNVIRACAEACVEDFTWEPVYDTMTAWAEHTNGRGLFLCGDVGTGKTFLAIIYAALAYAYHGALFTIVTGQELNTHADDVLHDRFLLVDDAGVEDVRNHYGTKSFVLSDLVDMAERRGAFLIITTNLAIGEFYAKYGPRTYDRLTELCKSFCFTGESHRCGGKRCTIPTPPKVEEEERVVGLEAFKQYWASIPESERNATFKTEDGRTVPLHQAGAIAKQVFGASEELKI